jgi:hypothetical protein
MEIECTPRNIASPMINIVKAASLGFELYWPDKRLAYETA